MKKLRHIMKKNQVPKFKLVGPFNTFLDTSLSDYCFGSNN